MLTLDIKCRLRKKKAKQDWPQSCYSRSRRFWEKRFLLLLRRYRVVHSVHAAFLEKLPSSVRGMSHLSSASKFKGLCPSLICLCCRWLSQSHFCKALTWWALHTSSRKVGCFTLYASLQSFRYVVSADSAQSSIGRRQTIQFTMR